MRINTHVDRPDAELIAKLAEFGSTDLSDVTNGMGTVDPRIRPAYTPIKPAAGPAVTINLPTASLNVMKAGLEQTRPGDIVVVNGRGNIASTFMGANILRGMLHRGVAAFIIDGVVRDVSEIREDGLPVYTRGVATGGGPHGPDIGEVNFPIAFGGVVVNPGDIVVADEDGIIVIPPAIAEETLEAVKKLAANFAAIQPQLLEGKVTNIANIEKQLRDAGFEWGDLTKKS
jgi:regulator of RNase E activity RraA